MKRKHEQSLRSVIFIEQTPVGSLMAAGTETGICSLCFCNLQDFMDTMDQGLLKSNGVSFEILERVAAQIHEYFNSSRKSFDVPLDISGESEFTQKVLMAALEIPFGRISTYGKLAVKIGKLDAARAVGGALGRNPIPIIIPCHRVVASTNRLQGFSSRGGIETKAQLLRLEGLFVKDGRVKEKELDLSI